MYKIRWLLALLLLSYLGFLIWHFQPRKETISKIDLETAPEPREVFLPDWEKLYYAAQSSRHIVVTLVVDCPQKKGMCDIYLVDGQKEIYVWTAITPIFEVPKDRYNWMLNLSVALRQFKNVPSQKTRLILKQLLDDNCEIILHEVKFHGIILRD